MASNKKVSLDIAIDGEAKYKQALQSLNSQLKTLGTESKKLSAIYSGEANTYDALIAKSKLLAAQQDALTNKISTLKETLTAANTALEKHRSQTESLRSAQQAAQKAYDSAAEKTDELQKALNSANTAYERNQDNIKYTERRIQTYTQQLNLADAELIVLNREMSKTDGYLQEAATSFDGTARSIDKYGNEVKDAAEDTKSFANAADLLAQAIVASGAIEGAEKLRDAIIATAKASIEYESAFAGVKKTVDGTAEELEALSGGLRNMSLEIPIAATELAGIAESAGQLGIETGNIRGFTEVMAQLGVTTNLSANEAATALAKFANITKMSESEYSNLGSSIVALGNNFATTEADIVAMATRLASTGEVVGLTEPQILAVATALSSVGIEAEAGGSAFSKLLKTIETEVETGSKKVDSFAKIAGMSAKEFASAWRKDAVGAVAEFINGLGKLEGSGISAVSVLDALGLTEVRLSNAVLALASSEGILTDALDLSNSAWAENTALAEEAAVRFETTESKLQLLSNAFENLKITVGDELVGQFGGAIDGLTDLTQAADEYVKKNPEIVTALTALSAGIGSFAVIGTVLPLIGSLSTALLAIPHGAVAAGIAALVAAIAAFVVTMPEASDKVSIFERNLESLNGQISKTRDGIVSLKEANEQQTTAIKTEADEIEKAIAKVEELGNKTDLTASESEILKQSINTLNGSIPGLRLSYDNLNDSLEDTVYHLRLVASAQALVDEAVSKSELRDSLEGNFGQLDKDIADAKKALDDANVLLEEYIALRDEFTAAPATQSGRARGVGSTYNPYDDDVQRLKQAVEDADALYSMAIGAREANKRKILEIDAEITKLDSAYAEKAEEIKSSTIDLFESTEEGAAIAAKAVIEAANQTKKSTKATKEGAAIAAKAVIEAANQTKKSTKATKEATDEAGKAIIEHAKTVKSNLEALSKEYDSVYKSAQSSLGGIGGLFGEIAFKTDKSISDMLSGLDSQADYFTGYMLNLQRAAQIGIDDGLVAALADGSDESAGYLQMIVNEFNKVAEKYGESSTEAEDFVNDFNSKFEATSKAKDALAGTIAGIQTNFEERAQDILADAESLVDELSGYGGNAYDEVATAVSETLTAIADGFGQFQIAAQEKSQGIIDAANYIKQGINTTLEVLPEEMKVAGQNVSLGLAEGILDKSGELEAAVRRLANEAILAATKDELGIHSPSEEGREIGKFYDEGIAQGIERNKSTVLSANLDMIQKLEAQSQSAAAAAGRSLGNTMAKSMAETLRAGQALRQQVESGTLTVNGQKVQSVASAGIPSLTGQAAIDWNEEQKRDFGLPDDWSNQDIVDWLNAGGAQSGGYSSSTQAAVDSAIKNENSGKVSLTQTTNKAWHDSYLNQLNANKSKSNSGGSTVVVNQTFTGTTSPHQVKKAAEEGVKNAVYY